MQYKLLIFDWDGTLIDSAARIVSSFQLAAQELGYDKPSDDAVRDIIGLGLPEAIKKVMQGISESEVAPFRDAYSRQFLELNRTPVNQFEGVSVGLHKLAGHGFRLAVATGKSRRGLNRALSDSGFQSLFESTRCADETLSKPDPLMLNQILEETQLSVEEAVMIGDTVYDLEMAQNIGMDRIAVSYGVHSKERLDNHKPVLMADTFNEVVSWLTEKR